MLILNSDLVANILGTEIMDNKTHTITNCCFANVCLPLIFVSRDPSQHIKMEEQAIYVDEAPQIGKWITDRTVFDFNTMVPAQFHAGKMWVRFSGQIYLEMGDFDYAGTMLKGLCERVKNGEGRA